MGFELLEGLTRLLEEAGIPAGEEYPRGNRVEIHQPVAAVGLRELDCANSLARFSVRILSPRILGGWCCQRKAAKAVQVLHGAGMSCTVEEMEFSSGSDCFCVRLIATQSLRWDGESWSPGHRWQVLIDGVEENQVISFRSVRSQGRRLVGAFCQSAPIGVTPGTGGWQLELVQSGAEAGGEEKEPFVLTVRAGGVTQRFTGCCWNETEISLGSGGLKRIRRGFALEREVETDG